MAVNRRRPKSANKAGGTTRHASGKWMARATVVDPETGLSVRKTWYGDTEQEAREKMNAAVAAYRLGAPVARGRELTLRRWADQWLANREIRESTRLRYRQCLDLAMPKLGDRPLSRITPSAVRELLVELHRKRGLKTRGANRVRDVLRNLLNDAMSEGYVNRNVANLADPLRQDDVEEMSILPPADMPVFLAMAREHPDGGLWAVGLLTGCRLGELQGLRWSDVDLDDRIVNIERQLRRVGNQYVVTPPKSKQSRRQIPLSEGAVTWLERERSRQAAARLAAGKKWSGGWSDHVFLDELGQPRNPTTVSYRMKAAMRAAGLEPIRFHDLRHTAGSVLLAQLPVIQVSRHMGHSRPSTTTDFYGHTAEKVSREAALAMDRLTGSQRAQ